MRTRQRVAITQEGCNPPTPPVELTTQRQSYEGMPTALISDSCQLLSMSEPRSVHIKRQFGSHLSSASTPAAQCQKLVSEQLDTSYNSFLSCLGSFIGRLQVQSQSSADLLVAVQQSATVGLELLVVVEVVCAHDNQNTKSLDPARTLMDNRIKKLMSAARNISMSSASENEDVAMTQQNDPLLMAATNCVRAAGECVMKTSLIIERIGDFEFESQSKGLGINMASTDLVTEEETKTTPAEPQVIIPKPTRAPPPTPLMIQRYESPLAKVPSNSRPAEDNIARLSLKPVAKDDTTGSATALFCDRTSRTLLPLLPKMASLLLTKGDYNTSDQSSSHNEDYLPSFLRRSSALSSSGMSSTYLSSMCESNKISTATTTTTSDVRPKRSTFVLRPQYLER